MNRRQLLRATGVASVTALTSVAGCSSPDEESPNNSTTPSSEPDGTTDGDSAETYKLGGEVGGWQGQQPQSIAGTENPTLSLTAGTTYELTWENLDGGLHDFTIEDSDGNTLEQTEQKQQEGATTTLTFTATEAMAAYYCTVHPSRMRGSIDISTQ